MKALIKNVKAIAVVAVLGTAAVSNAQVQQKPAPKPPVVTPTHPSHVPMNTGIYWKGPVCVPVQPVVGISVPVRPIVEVCVPRPVIEVVVAQPVVVVEPVVERRWIEPVYEERQSKIWIEPVYRTIPGEKFFVEPVYRTVVDRIWRAPLVREEQVRVLIPAVWIEREVIHPCHCQPVRIEKVLVPARYEVKYQRVVVRAGCYEDVARQELVTAGRWECRPDQQVLVTAGFFETRGERVLVTAGHWETVTVVVEPEPVAPVFTASCVEVIDVEPAIALRTYCYEPGFPPGCYIYGGFCYYGGHRYPERVFRDRFVSVNIRERRFIDVERTRRESRVLETRHREAFAKTGGIRHHH